MSNHDRMSHRLHPLLPVLATVAALAAISLSLCLGRTATAQEPGEGPAGVIRELNGPDAKLSDDNKKSGPRVFLEWIKVPAPPAGRSVEVWPGMKDWSKVSAWAQGASALGDILVTTQNARSLGLPYGMDGVSPAFQEKGISVDFGTGDDFGIVTYGYLDAVRGIGVYAAAEMYRAAEAKDWTRAFDVGVAWLRFLRLVADREMMAESACALAELESALSVHRDFLWRYRDAIPAEVCKRASLKQYPFLHAGDGERLEVLELPEGDRLLAKAVMEQRTFSGDEPDEVQFVELYGAKDSADAPLMRFGTVKMWERIASHHGARAASIERLDGMYDDWHRRWRSNPYGRLSEVPTMRSKTNALRYAAVIFSIQDLQEFFAARKRVIASINGTALAAGLCSYRWSYEGRWPSAVKAAHAAHIVKRFDFDPFDKQGQTLSYRTFEGSKNLQVPGGSVSVPEVMLWSLGMDGKNDNLSSHTDDGSKGDILLWPPVRELQRESRGGK
ncbi:MAG: hypothetical protein O2855_00265 [Planctomycetota bacterium]|nr:hypothetical protein [Planctomycetota bacterium]